MKTDAWLSGSRPPESGPDAAPAVLVELAAEAGVTFNGAAPWDIQVYNERFYRMWHYYLMSSAGLFRSRQGLLWQLVLSKRGRAAVYRSVR